MLRFMRHTRPSQSRVLHSTLSAISRHYFATPPQTRTCSSPSVHRRRGPRCCMRRLKMLIVVFLSDRTDPWTCRASLLRCKSCLAGARIHHRQVEVPWAETLEGLRLKDESQASHKLHRCKTRISRTQGTHGILKKPWHHLIRLNWPSHCAGQVHGQAKRKAGIKHCELPFSAWVSKASLGPYHLGCRPNNLGSTSVPSLLEASSLESNTLDSCLILQSSLR